MERAALGHFFVLVETEKFRRRYCIVHRLGARITSGMASMVFFGDFAIRATIDMGDTFPFSNDIFSH